MTSVVNSINIQYVKKSNAIPGQGTKISQAMWYRQNVKKKKERNLNWLKKKKKIYNRTVLRDWISNQNLPTKKNPEPDDFTGSIKHAYLTCKGELTPSFSKYWK